MAQFREKAEFLSSKQASVRNTEAYVAELFQPSLLVERGKVNTGLPPLRDELKRTALQVVEAIETGPGAKLTSSKGTWWGAFNGVTYSMDHQRRSQDEGNALHSAWFGSAANVKRKALEKAIEYAQAA